MKINLLKKIKNIDSILDPVRGIISFSNKIIMNDDIIFNGQIYSITLFKDSLMIAIESGKSSCFMNLRNLKSKFFTEIGVIDFFLDDENVIYGLWNGDYSKREIKSIDLKLNKVLWKKDYSFGKIYLNDNSFFATVDKDISQIEKQTGNRLWQFTNLSNYNWTQKSIYENEAEVEKQAEVIKFLGVYKNELWLVLNSGALLALNIETGKESRYINEGKMIVGESDFEDFKGYFGYNTVLDEENGLIFNLNRHFYLEYNLNSKNSYFDSYSFKESSQKHDLNLNYVGGFEGDFIYSYEGSDNNRFAIFSRDKKEIIWSGEIEEVKGKFPAIRDLQYGAGKIYVLDNDNTLHIFERD